jgi:hypothetical protein
MIQICLIAHGANLVAWVEQTFLPVIFYVMKGIAIQRARDITTASCGTSTSSPSVGKFWGLGIA